MKAAETAEVAKGFIDVDDPDLLLPGDMPARINAQRKRNGLEPVSSPPVVARLIFESLAAKYAQVLKDITHITGKKLQTLVRRRRRQPESTAESLDRKSRGSGSTMRRG